MPHEIEYTYPSPSYTYLDRYWDGEDDDGDGLKKVHVNPVDQTWPFSAATADISMRGVWTYNDKFSIWHFRDTATPRTEAGQSEICNHWVAAHASTDLCDAAAHYRLAISRTANTATEALFQALCCGSLGLLLGGYYSTEDKKKKRQYFLVNEQEAVRVYKIGAEVFKLPSCRFLYGKALYLGMGGLKENPSRGLAHLHEAGSARIGEALYEIGRICELKQYQKFERSRRFFEAAREAYNFTLEKNENDFLTCASAIVNPPQTEGWTIQQDESVSRIGDVYGWLVVGQAFLIGAAAALTTETQPQHFGYLLLFLPILGILMSSFTIVLFCGSLIRMSDLRRARLAKVMAYVTIARAANENCIARKSSLKFMLERLHYHACCYLLLGINIVFWFAWVFLLPDEVRGHRDGCFEWWPLVDCSAV